MEIFKQDKNLVFDCLKKTQKMSSSSIISEIKKSGLRGRGGAGFPAGLKWELVQKEKATPKYIVCNAHEGEPETLKDKYILENFPHLVLAGMLIASRAIGSKDLFIAIKETYKKAINKFKKEIADFRKKGFLQGTVPAGTVPCKITVFPAKLGYIGGEESGVLNEIEGKRIEPRQKPPFVSQIGLFGKPTLINNVESFANIPFIISEGAKEFKKFGTEKSPGEKMITVSGDVEKPGVYKINFGQTLNDILEIAKGPSLGKIKFALTGGFASTAITPEKFNIPFDFDSFSFGVCVGAGTVIFYNDKTDLLKEMKKWLEFFKNESCGQCTPCREGTQRLYEIIQNTLRLRSGQAKNPSTTLRAGKISKTDLARMEEMFFALETSSFCPLGASAPMAAKGLISSFRKELISEK